MNKKILILGKGFIGEILQKALNCQVSDTLIKSYSDAEKIITRYRPQIIINSIGITGRINVDDCEKDIDGVLLANSFVPVILAEVAIRYNIKLVHIKGAGHLVHLERPEESLAVLNEFLGDSKQSQVQSEKK